MADIFIDKRFLVNGRRSVLHLDNPFNLTAYITDYLYLFTLTCAQNGLGITTSIHSSGVQQSCVTLGGELNQTNTIVDGQPGVQRNLGFGSINPLTYFGVVTDTIDGGTGEIDLFAKGHLHFINTLDGTGIRINPDTGATSGLNLITWAVTQATASNDEVLTLVDNGSGEVEYKPIKYVQSFITTDWVGTNLIVLASTHGRGVNPIVQVINDDTGYLVLPGNSLTGVVGLYLNEIKITANGDVTLVHGSVGVYNGRIIIT